MEELIYECEQINSFMNDGNCFDEYDGNINDFIKKIVESIKLRVLKKNDDNKYIVSRLISRYIGFEDIEFDDDDLMTLLDYIDWYYPSIMQHAEDWTASEEQAGCDFVKILKFSIKMNRKITGLNDVNTLFGILMGILHCEDEDTEQFVLDNKIKMPKKMFKINDCYDSNMYDIENWFREKNYNIIEQE